MSNDDPADRFADDLDPDELDVDDDLAADVDELIEDRSVPSAAGDPATAGESAPSAVAAESDETIVSTQHYCRSCEYFSEPPEVHCNHEGTTIVEFVDLEHAKVRDCPVVARRRSLVEQANAAFVPNTLQE